ncbi:PAS domain-containing sensor histidine kinase [Streptomyces sp. S.PB5]|uniref:PAS domain-containing sensor histidine kinase n=1 Tax=Streptomyces sp. S.PB5 TaxID=3020844 RepID=UPI0025B0D070|nr:PAS domain-containing sensor histidine kinase [Streptomyces sp. S.PB5]MDN3028099.1 ATP-binding protein [Streptomyces sp. S.PB5]
MQVESQVPEFVPDDFLALMNASVQCVLIHDAATKNILWANPAACEVLEWSVTELRPLKANHMSSSAQQYDRVLGRAWLQEAVEKGTSRTEWHYRSRTGRVIPTDAVATRVELARGPVVMVQFRDIEREQQIERELRLTTSYVEALAHHTSALALMLDPAGGIRFATDTALSALGAPLNEPLELLQGYARVWLDGRLSTWEAALERADPVSTVQLEVPSRDDDRRWGTVWLEGSLEQLRAEGEGFLMLLHDVSERVQEEQRRERELQQENYLARYNAMGDMAMAIAHELGQPLAAAGNFLAGVRSRARLLESQGRAEPGTTDALAYGLESAERQIERAATIVNSVRAFVGHLEHSLEVVDLNDIVEECLYFVRLRAAQAGVRVETGLSPEPVRVRCERVLTGQVVLNLCFNAVDELAQCEPGHHVLRVVSARNNNCGLIQVEDTGRGLQRDPFAESFTSKEHGSGIGLALSYRIITRQHGVIWAESREGGGSRFSFALPFPEAGPDENC